jgi:sugar lactone lactonase YvrE
MAANVNADRLELVAGFPGRQITGIAVSKQNRIFVNLPFWADPHTISVAEVQGNNLVPYPDAAWNQNEGDPAKRFVCVQSVYIDDENRLWVLDPAATKMGPITKGGPKLVLIDLTTNQVTGTVLFDENIAPEKSYLNDVRVDTRRGFAFITDSGLGALVVVNLKTRQVRRCLADHPSTKAEPGLNMVIQGVALRKPGTGKPFQGQSDGIAFNPDDGYVYYQALTGHTLYRIAAAALEDFALTDAELGQKVEPFTKAPVADGLWYDREKIYSTALEAAAIDVIDLKTRQVSTLVKDDRLHWPDSFAQGPDGWLYVTTSQIHLTPRFNNGQSKVQDPFSIFRVRLESP